MSNDSSFSISPKLGANELSSHPRSVWWSDWSRPVSPAGRLDGSLDGDVSEVNAAMREPRPLENEDSVMAYKYSTSEVQMK